ncbi:hypothetical protein Tco_0788938, partial [Tanacetum coccineum]
DVARSHGGDGGGEDHPPPYHVATDYGGCFANRDPEPLVKGNADKQGPIPIRFEVRDKKSLMPLGDHAAHWSSYIGEVIRGVPLYYPSWLKVPKERKAALITDIGTQFDLRPHMKSPDWTVIEASIQQHLQKAYNTNKAAFKAQHWVIDTEIGTYNVEKIRRPRLEGITTKEWDKDPGRLLAFEMRWQSSSTQEYPSLIDTFFIAHTVNGVFTRDEDRLIYKEIRRLEATSTYTDDEINRLARRGKQRRHIPGVGKVLPARVTADPSRPAPESTLKSLHKKVDFMMSLFKSDSKFSDAFSQFESAGASESGGSGECGDDEECNTPKNTTTQRNTTLRRYFIIHNARYKRTTSKCRLKK